MLIRLAALGALGVAGFRYFKTRKTGQNEAFAEGEAGGSNFSQVRNAGPKAMKDPPKDTWDSIDEESDESFPASDPPGNY
ncbi:hypothetical protein [Aurantiacibacter marinus]|uniref:Uncharacterized protein n=1 Tax=Aurantiacibacter marinus TaxID=874156 RepID=A0A0H0XQM3_9SPHN|nr:hypothetical protein [Aurantiacibacter marinus]KLI64654.1 hypothetical protein AAV99_03635 [Aurantiacibacter marinus]